MTNESGREENLHTVEMPAPTPWPMITALGLTLSCAGLVTSFVVSVLGVVLVVAGGIGWFREVLPEEQREQVRAEALPAAAATTRVAVAYLRVGERGHRARLPLEIYPYSAGIKGGVAGGVAMAVLAVAYGVVAYGSPFYTINILAATALPDLASASSATLSSFHASVFFVALFIHAVVSLLVGLLYGVMLPMLPRRPVFFGGLVAPLVWSGLIWASLKVVNPVLEVRIDWIWFIVCQIGYGLAAGLVVARSERVATFQHLPLAVRAGIETPGVGEREERE
jgi:hypothetical protein